MRDAHHLLHYAREWRVRPEAKAIREHRSLIPRLDREVHVELHRTVPPVPMLGYHALKRVANIWTPHEDTETSAEALLLAIDRSLSHPSTHRIEWEMGQLTMQAIELQLPFIRQVPMQRQPLGELVHE